MAFEIKRNDRRPYFQVQLTENAFPADISTAVAARFIMKSGTTVKVNRGLMDFVDKPNGIVRYKWLAVDTDTSGTYNCEVEIDWGNGEYQTFPSKGYFTVTISDDLG